MPVYPGQSKPTITQTGTIKRGGYNLSSFAMGTHVGTHVDAPKHVVPDGMSIDNVPLANSIGVAVAIDLSYLEIGSGISKVDLERHDSLVNPGDIVILYTGCSDHWGEPDIETNYTYLEKTAAEWLVAKKVKAVGIDTLGVDRYESPAPAAHKALLSNGIIIIESLSNTVRNLVGKRFQLICLPLKLRSAEAAPARVVAYE